MLLMVAHEHQVFAYDSFLSATCFLVSFQGVWTSAQMEFDVSVQGG